MNKKLFFGILTPLLIIVIGILIWQFCFDRGNIIFKNDNTVIENNLPIINPIIPETDLATSDWYEYNIPPNYYVHNGIVKTLLPAWIKDIYFIGSNSNISTWTIFFYNSSDNKIQKAYISTGTGAVAFVRENIQYENEIEVGSRSIYIISQDKQIKKIFEVTKSNTDFNLDSYGDISFSPNGNFISLVQYGYEWSTPLILDINTGVNIIAEKNINAGPS
ncbi:MAG: hypothetical protein PHV47_01625, partial [Candidatus Pacebacteria bacterium]|nr:hypothetical protein [Candidatus Paceibacterota bacterium]